MPRACHEMQTPSIHGVTGNQENYLCRSPTTLTIPRPGRLFQRLVPLRVGDRDETGHEVPTADGPGAWRSTMLNWRCAVVRSSGGLEDRTDSVAILAAFDTTHREQARRGAQPLLYTISPISKLNSVTEARQWPVRHRVEPCCFRCPRGHVTPRRGRDSSAKTRIWALSSATLGANYYCREEDRYDKRVLVDSRYNRIFGGGGRRYRHERPVRTKGRDCGV